jgi:MRG
LTLVIVLQVHINIPPGREAAAASSTPGGGRGRKPRKDGSGREEEPFLTDPSVLSDEVVDTKISIDIPMELKYILCNDWDLVVNQKKLFTIPAKASKK